MLEEAKEAFKAIMESKPMQEVGSELGRLGVQGQAEIAGALFNESAYVPYGAGQQNVNHDAGVDAPETPEIEMEGREL